MEELSLQSRHRKIAKMRKSGWALDRIKNCSGRSCYNFVLFMDGFLFPIHGGLFMSRAYSAD